MTDNDFRDTFLPRLVKLFHRYEFTEDEVEVWRSRVRKLPMSEADSALNDLYTNAQGRPRIADFLKYVRETKHVTQDFGKPKQTRGQSLAEYAQAVFQTTNEYEAIVLYRRDCFDQALDTYGPDQPTTRACFDKWQAAVAETGRERLVWNEGHWADEYRRRHGEATQAADVTSWLREDGGNDDEHDSASLQTLPESGGDVPRPADGPGRAGGDAVEALHGTRSGEPGGSRI